LQSLYKQAPRCWTRELTIQALFRLVTEVVAQAVLCAVRAAVSVTSNGQWIPCAAELSTLHSSF
jgi:L-aminopeptidase/D-esterase-like protein